MTRESIESAIRRWRDDRRLSARELIRLEGDIVAALRLRSGAVVVDDCCFVNSGGMLKCRPLIRADTPIEISPPP